MDSTRINKFLVPKGDSLEPPPSSHPILTNGYDIRPAFIAIVREQPFNGQWADDMDGSIASYLLVRQR
jgi:hypothetical protein